MPTPAADPLSDLSELIPLGKVPRLLPKRSGGRRPRVHPGTIHRWRNPGIRGVRLQCVKCGASYHTTQKWLVEFFAALAAADNAGGAAEIRRAKGFQQAERSLEAAGI
jgi:hypothetical protein